MLKDKNVMILNQIDDFKIRSPLEIGEKVLVLAERLKKKNAPDTLYKNTTKNMPLFNCEHIFIVGNGLPKINSNDYWISKTEDGDN